MSEKTREKIMRELAAPFGPDEVKAKPAVVSGNRALALFYIDARLVMDRLDDVLGIGNWQAKYRAAEEGVVCSLSIKIGGEWIVHEDFGGFSEQPDEGDKHKAAFSDALKRAAVHLGIGRYLYRLPQLWADYDPQKRQFKTRPTLPAQAVANAVHKQPAPEEQAAQPSGEKQPEKQAEKPQQAAQKQQQPSGQKAAQVSPMQALMNEHGADVARKRLLAGLRQFGIPPEVALTEATASDINDLDEPRLTRLREKYEHLKAGTMTKEQAFPTLIAAKGKTKKGKPADPAQIARLEELRLEMCLGVGFVAAELRRYGVQEAGQLTEAQAAELVGQWEDMSRQMADEAASIEVPC